MKVRALAAAACAGGLALAPSCSSPSLESATRAQPCEALPTAADPEELGWSTARLSAVERLAESLGSAAVLIVTDGRVVLSYGDVSANLRAHSIRKSLLSALYGIAVADGRIDLTHTLSQLGIDDKAGLTAAEKRATVEDLLEARSGVYLPAASEVASMRDSRPRRHAHEPGAHWYYNNWDFNALGTIYRQETGEDVFEAFHLRIAVPIGMQDFDPAETRYQYEDASVHPSYKFRISARDLARFGQLYLNGGVWRGRQVVPADWVARSTRARSTTGSRGTKSGYGMMWWVLSRPRDEPGSFSERGAFTASGTGGHRLTVIPAIDTVVVYRSNTDDPDGARIGSSAYDRFLARVMEARLAADFVYGTGATPSGSGR